MRYWTLQRKRWSPETKRCAHGLQSAHWCTQFRFAERTRGTSVLPADPVIVETFVLCKRYASNKAWWSFAVNMSYFEGMVEALWRADRPSWQRRILAFSCYDWLEQATINTPGKKNKEELIAEFEDSTLKRTKSYIEAYPKPLHLFAVYLTRGIN